ncbi:hypothetical protein [Fulvivirga lutimaris]|uniref:hypothetical protein n=1 Tax=Fulvivirga lutimaris TaxID=1819566 RepID=UPI0012BCAD6D|nr:hypothetical protein [Fulvivirga lutimaris]MTI37887.1 hypothetical protein [Fulvivirga lutimaris]
MYSKAKILATAFLLIPILSLSTSCKKSDPAPTEVLTVTTSSGNTISLDGKWLSGCVTDMGANIDETFIFEGNELIIVLSFFQESSCTELAGSEKVTIEFEIDGTFEALLNEVPVIANKMIGTQTTLSSGITKEFKQSLYINDDNGGIFFHHARFQDDGGEQTSDGFPLELIPLKIVKL